MTEPVGCARFVQSRSQAEVRAVSFVFAESFYIVGVGKNCFCGPRSNAWYSHYQLGGGLDVDQDSVVDWLDFAMSDGCCIEIIKE